MAKPLKRRTAAPPDDASTGFEKAAFDEDLNYTCDIKIFQASPDVTRGMDFLSAPEFPSDRVVPGYLCQAARLMAGLTQQELHVSAGVSKKTINDYENGFIVIRASLAGRLATALRTAGVRFVAGEGYIGALLCGGRNAAGRQAAPPWENEAAADNSHVDLPNRVGRAKRET
ncbi:helix-turn-helix domain-containing protein [Methylobacterium sp. D54C]